MSKKKILSINFSAGAYGPTAELEKDFEKSKGFAYEFTLDSKENIESFERFMAGDVTHAQNLSKFKKSGVVKISDMSDSRIGFSRSFGMATPFIPIIAFKTSSERDYDHSEEDSVWDEKEIKDTGIYIKQRNLSVVGQQVKEARSFIGGRILNEVPGLTNSVAHSEKLYGNFKFSYQSNWGQEHRLRKYIKKVQDLTGLVDETCASVPSFKDTLGFNQVSLEVNWSDEYVKEIVGLGKSKTKLLHQIKSLAQNFQSLTEKSGLNPCTSDEINKDDENCTGFSSSSVEDIFVNLETYSDNMHKTFSSDRKEFAKNLAKFGEEVWKSPAVFKAFYEKGKLCGQEFKFEVSGQRISRHVINQKYVNTATCTVL